MEQIGRKRRMRSRERKRIIRRRGIFVYRCICVGILAAIMIVFVKFLPDIVSTVKGGKPLVEYPQSLLDLLERNPETKDFVLDYPVNKDIDFEIDLSSELKEGTIPLFLQWDIRWGYEVYGSDFLAITGCGPTCLSMVRCGLGGEDEWNPLEVAKMSEEHGFYVDGAGTSWELMSTGAKQLGLDVYSVIYDEAHIIAELEKGKYYLQIATLRNEDNIKNLLKKYTPKYPVVLVKHADGISFQILVGPLSADEYGMITERFKSYGFKDCFLRKIK